MTMARRDALSAPFFESLVDGRLSVPRCGECGAWQAPARFYSDPPVRCAACGANSLGWTPVGGAGKVVTWTTDPNFLSVFDGSPGQTSGLVELDEGPWIAGAFSIPAEELRAGLPVMFEPVVPLAGGEPIPAFRLAEPPGRAASLSRVSELGEPG